MSPVKRIGAYVAAVVLAMFAVSVLGGPRLGYMVDPMTMLSVVTLTAVLATLTYPAGQVARQMKLIFTRRTPTLAPNRRMIGQLALFAMISGIILAIMHVLLTLKNAPADSAVPCAISLRTPFVCLLYGVLLALGLWVVGQEQRQPNAGPADCYDQNQVILASCLLLLATGVVGYLLFGLVSDQRSHGLRAATPSTAPLAEDRAVPAMADISTGSPQSSALATALRLNAAREAAGKRSAMGGDDAGGDEWKPLSNKELSNAASLSAYSTATLAVLRWEAETPAESSAARTQ